MKLENLTVDLAADRLSATIAEGRLIQGSWHREQDGRHLACVLGSFDDNIKSEADCPAQIMPAWMAHVTVRVFDDLSDADYLPWAEQYAKSMHTWDALDGPAWDRIQIKFKVYVIHHALESARKVSDKLPDGLWAKVEAACNGVVAALEGKGDLKAAAAAAADAAADAAAAAAAADAAADAADAADAAADADAAAARWAAAAAAAAAADAAAAAAADAADAAADAAAAAADAAAAAADAAADAARWAAAADAARWADAADAARKDIAYALLSIIAEEVGNPTPEPQ